MGGGVGGLGCVGVHDDDVALLEVVDEGVHVGELDATALVVAALHRQREGS